MFQVAFRSIAPRGGVGQGGMQMFLAEVKWTEQEGGNVAPSSFYFLPFSFGLLQQIVSILSWDLF